MSLRKSRDLGPPAHQRGHHQHRRGRLRCLVPGAIENRGIITARGATIAMAAGKGVRVSMAGGGLVSIDITEAQADLVYDYQGNSVLDQIRMRAP